MPDLPSEPDLAAFLDQHHQEVVDGWLEILLARPGTLYTRLPRAKVRRWLGEGLDVIIEGLSTGDEEVVARYLAHIARRRWDAGFGIDEVTRALLLLRDAAVPLVERRLPGSPSDVARSTRALDATVRFSVVLFSARFAEHIRRSREQVAILEERQRLARELHDSVSQHLYASSLMAEAVSRTLRGAHREVSEQLLRDLQDSTFEAQRLLRLVIFELRPCSLAQVGLVAALEERLAAVESRARMATLLDAELPGPLPAGVEADLFGIAQEALNNALKHARARRVEVSLGEAQGQIRLEILDDGDGFDVAAGRRRGGLGLRGMDERAARLGAELQVNSTVGRGTRVRVVVPGAEQLFEQGEET